jgi:hypothetical protein
MAAGMLRARPKPVAHFMEALHVLGCAAGIGMELLGESFPADVNELKREFFLQPTLS